MSARGLHYSLGHRHFPICTCFTLKRGRGGKERVWGQGLSWNVNYFNLWSDTFKRKRGGKERVWEQGLPYSGSVMECGGRSQTCISNHSRYDCHQMC